LGCFSGPGRRSGRAAIARSDLKKNRAASEASFRRLLTWLDGGVESGGESYLEIRRRLSAFFDRRNCHFPDDLADETLNRVARRLEEEGSIIAGPPARYCYVVAKFVFLEYVRDVRRQGGPEVAVEARDLERRVSAPLEDAGSAEKRLSCLDRCLASIPPEDRELILAYYGRGEGRNADRRRDLAARLGLTANALAIRACRIRDTLERCVRSCEAEQ
jgi:DNA-directed RNA polymerase specialized sigma24 family protein